MTSAPDRSSMRPTRSSRLRRFVVITVLVGIVAGCATKSEAQVATDSLNAGLQAHVAGKLDEATTDYKECLKHDATNKLCLYNLGLVAQTQGRTAEAESDYRLALSTDPNYTPAIFNLAIIRTAAGSTQEAITLYRQFVKLAPNDAGGHLNLGLLLTSTGNKTEGDKEIAAALQLDPTLGARLTSPAPNGSPATTPVPSTPAPSPSASPTRSSSAKP